MTARATTVRFRAVGFLAVAATLAALIAAAAGDDPQPLRSWRARFEDLLKAGRCDEAEEALRNIDQIAQGSSQIADRVLADYHKNLAGCYHLNERYEKAARHLEEACRLWQEAREVALLLRGLSTLVRIYDILGDWDQEESTFRRALEVVDRWPDSKDKSLWRASFLHGLGELYRHQGRYGAAEPCLREALELREKHLAADDLDLRRTRLALAELWRRQGRSTDARSLYEKVVRASKESEPEMLAVAHGSLALVYFDLGWDQSEQERDRYWKAAEGSYKAALAAFEKSPLRGTPLHADCLNNLAFLYDQQHRYAEAEPRYTEALQMLQDAPARDPGRIVDTLNNLAWLNFHRHDLPAARRSITQAIEEDAPGVPLEYRYNSYYRRANVSWADGSREQALDDLREAMQLAVRQRALGSGTPYDRAQFFAQLTNAFERMVEWQVELAGPDGQSAATEHVAEAYQAIERARALSLLDQMKLGDADLLRGIPGDEAQRLRQRRDVSLAEVMRLEQEFRVLAGQGKLSEQERQSAEDLKQRLQKAHQECADAQRQIWALSPACRQALGALHDAEPLNRVQQGAEDRQAAVLEYMLGVEGGYLLVIPAGGQPPWLERLELDATQAFVLGVEPGPLTAKRLQQVLRNPQKKGLWERLAVGDAAQSVTDRLFVLWQALVPGRVRSIVLEPSLKRLVIIPDGALALLPFEALVVDPDGGPEYLLDAGPPIVYVPSATVLVRLSELPRRWKPEELRRQPSPGGKAPVLSVAKWDYKDHPDWGPLEETETESNWVSQNFQKADVLVEQIPSAQATESRVRKEIPGRWMVHLACHGLGEQDAASLHGTLILTIGPQGRTDRSDDGYLILPEIYGLDLSGCELVLPSACRTNFGPAQRGEGVWALTRGFLVAGARRAVATSWDVDDRAGASLVSVLCGALARDLKQGGDLDYAAALQEAKKWTRNPAMHPDNPEWQHPFYWAAFVLVGPD